MGLAFSSIWWASSHTSRRTVSFPRCLPSWISCCDRSAYCCCSANCPTAAGASSSGRAARAVSANVRPATRISMHRTSKRRRTARWTWVYLSESPRYERPFSSPPPQRNRGDRCDTIRAKHMNLVVQCYHCRLLLLRRNGTNNHFHHPPKHLLAEAESLEMVACRYAPFREARLFPFTFLFVLPFLPNAHEAIIMWSNVTSSSLQHSE